MAASVAYFDNLVRLVPRRYYRPAQQDFEESLVVDESATQAPERKTKKAKKKNPGKDDGPDAGGNDGGAAAELAEGAVAAGFSVRMRAAEAKEEGKPGNASTLDELRARMKAKMDQLKRKRSHGKDPEEGLSKRAKRKERVDKLKKETPKNDKKDKAKKKKETKKEDGEASEDAPLPVEAAKKDKGPNIDLQFSAIAAKPADPTKRKKRIKGGKDALALRKVEKFEERVAEVKEEDPERAERMLHGAAVSSSLLRAAGVKVQDNKKLLKKSLKRKEKSREKSAKAWKGRSKEVAKSVEAGIKEGKEKRFKAKNKSKARMASKLERDKAK